MYADEYIEYMYSEGGAMPTTVRLSPDIKARIKRLSEQTGRTQSYYINEAIERQLIALSGSTA